MKLVLGLLCCAALATGTVLDEFKAFRDKYDKAYLNEVEHAHRMMAFASNLDYITKHNEEAANGKHTFTLAVNQFADLTNEEWRQRLTRNPNPRTEYVYQMASVADSDRPDSVDWRDEGYVTPVKDQGQCGSCWAFGATGSMEGAIFKKTQELVSLSESNLVDCDQQSSGCNGGLEVFAFQYVLDNGINTEDDYPYHARQLRCKFDDSNRVLHISKFIELPAGDEEGLTNKVATEGPISVGIDAGQTSFQLYHKGVYYDANCHTHEFQLNHAVLVVGYGVDGSEDYYMVKNSWGTGWGMEGYIKMARNRNNACGIATDANLPVA